MESSSKEDSPDGLTSIHVKKARGGNVESLEWLVKRFSPLLRSTAEYRMGKVLRRLYDPDDIVNDVWLVAVPKLPDLLSRDGRYTPVLLKFLSTTLLYRINNLVEKHIRGKPRQQSARVNTEGVAVEAVETLPSETTTIIRRLVTHEAHEIVSTSLEDLDPHDREIILLRGVEQRRYKEIESLTGKDRKTLAVVYQRAVEKLRKLLPGSVFDDFVDE